MYGALFERPEKTPLFETNLVISKLPVDNTILSNSPKRIFFFFFFFFACFIIHHFDILAKIN